MKRRAFLPAMGVSNIVMSMISLRRPLVSGPAFFASLRCLIKAPMKPEM